MIEFNKFNKVYFKARYGTKGFERKFVVERINSISKSEILSTRYSSELWEEVCGSLEICKNKTNYLYLYQIIKAESKNPSEEKEINDIQEYPAESQNENTFNSQDEDLTHSPDEGMKNSIIQHKDSVKLQDENVNFQPRDKENNFFEEYHSPSKSCSNLKIDDIDSKYWTKPFFQTNYQIQMSEDKWQELRKTQVANKFEGLEWVNSFIDILKTINSFCCFSFSRHRVQKINSRRLGLLFYSEGYCKFSSCPITFKIKIMDENLIINLNFYGDNIVHNKNELHARPIRGSKRKLFAHSLLNVLPREKHLQDIKTLPEDIYLSGNRDQAPSTKVLNKILSENNKRLRLDDNEINSLLKMKTEEQYSSSACLQHIIADPVGVMLWSKQSIKLFRRRSREDIAYLDATGSLMKKRKYYKKDKNSIFYIYELLVRSSMKGGSPLVVATYVTSSHTVSSVSYFLQSFKLAYTKMYGWSAKVKPRMLMSDGSIVILKSLAMIFCDDSLETTIEKYFRIIIGQASEQDFEIPIMHRCLSHIMKNAKMMAKKKIPDHFKFVMFLIGHLATINNLKEFISTLKAIKMVFLSQYRDPLVEINLNLLEAQINQEDANDEEKEENFIHIEIYENHEEDNNSSSFMKFIEEELNSVTTICTGVDPNIYFNPEFFSSLLKDFVPQAILWSALLLGDLGRHGTSEPYLKYSTFYSSLSNKISQNISSDNRTQGIMEKSQWDLKNICFKKQLNRLDDFVRLYQLKHLALLREFEDNEKTLINKHNIELEKWKKRRTNNKKGIYVSLPKKPLNLSSKIKNTSLNINSNYFEFESKNQIIPSTHMKQPPSFESTIFWQILNGISWLTSDHINFAMFLISRQYPQIDGLSDCEYLSFLNLRKNVDIPRRKFIQIINLRNQHWITISNIFCGPGEVDIYDSMTMSKTMDDMRIICYLTKNFNHKSLQVRYQKVQQQKGTSDCGPLAIAFASSLARGIDPASVSYNQSSLRSELVKVFRSFKFHKLEKGKNKKIA